jgi:hypothetical protein
MAVSFIGGGSRSTLRKPQTCHKSLTKQEKESGTVIINLLGKSATISGHLWMLTLEVCILAWTHVSGVRLEVRNQWTEHRNTCSNLFWWVQKTFLNILVSPAIVKIWNLKTLVSPSWKWWVKDSSRRVVRISAELLSPNTLLVW